MKQGKQNVPWRQAHYVPEETLLVQITLGQQEHIRSKLLCAARTAEQASRQAAGRQDRHKRECRDSRCAQIQCIKCMPAGCRMGTLHNQRRTPLTVQLPARFQGH
jgi:hypothetical protein